MLADERRNKAIAPYTLSNCTSRQRRCALGRPPVARSLFVAVGNLEQRRFTPWASKNLQTGRQGAADKSHRHRHGRKASRRREAVAVVAVRAVEVADQP